MHSLSPRDGKKECKIIQAEFKQRLISNSNSFPGFAVCTHLEALNHKVH